MNTIITIKEAQEIFIMPKEVQAIIKEKEKEHYIAHVFLKSGNYFRLEDEVMINALINQSRERLQAINNGSSSPSIKNSLRLTPKALALKEKRMKANDFG